MPVNVLPKSVLWQIWIAAASRSALNTVFAFGVLATITSPSPPPRSEPMYLPLENVVPSSFETQKPVPGVPFTPLGIPTGLWT